MTIEQLALDIAKLIVEIEHLEIGFSNHLSHHWALTVGLLAACIPLAFTVSVMLFRRLTNGKK